MKQKHFSLDLPKANEAARDGLLDSLAVIVPLICGRSVSEEEILYVRSRVGTLPRDVLCDALLELGDTADRVGNPIAAIRGKVATILKARNGVATADRISAEIAATSPEDRARSKEFLEGLQKRLAAGNIALVTDRKEKE